MGVRRVRYGADASWGMTPEGYCLHGFLFRGATRLPIPTRFFSAILADFCPLDISPEVFGVLGETLLDGRQYSLSPPAPHGFPVR